MTHLVFHHNHKKLPSAKEDLLPVQLYGMDGSNRGDISIIGNSIIEKIKRLGVPIPDHIFDFLTIALAVTAADTFTPRKKAEDGWSRRLDIQLPLYNPERWEPITKQLEHSLHFLSGDIWSFNFLEGGYAPPEPFGRRHKRVNLRELDCVCLFSGGLDSAIGAIDLIQEHRKPLLVSHGYAFDKGKQDSVASQLEGKFERLIFNADPHLANGDHDVSMRTRSLNFLAFAAVGASAVQVVSQQDHVDLFVPENGFISLNAPLTPRRTGTLSTRTTHPYFIGNIQGIFDTAHIPCRIINPYQFKTKGEMATECRDLQQLASIVDSTVSCSHWKRRNKQCGICVPCTIRRAALYAGDIREEIEYINNDLPTSIKDAEHNDDLMALCTAALKKSTRKIGPWILDSGPLPPNDYQEFKKVFSKGLDEVEVFLKSESVL